MIITQTGSLQWYESETEPPLEGPKLWFRPSDKAHFGRSDEGWVQYNPVHIEGKLKVGETMIVNVPPIPQP
jgi:hypothetical protein